MVPAFMLVHLVDTQQWTQFTVSTEVRPVTGHTVKSTPTNKALKPFWEGGYRDLFERKPPTK